MKPSKILAGLNDLRQDLDAVFTSGDVEFQHFRQSGGEALDAAIADYAARCGQEQRTEALKAKAEELQAQLEGRPLMSSRPIYETQEAAVQAGRDLIAKVKAGEAGAR